MRATYGDDVAIVCCGPAGEMQLKSAAVIVTTPEFLPRTASRGGMGAVMGSKKVKAVVINDKGATRTKVADPEALKVAVKAFSEGVRSHPAMGALGSAGHAVPDQRRQQHRLHGHQELLGRRVRRRRGPQRRAHGGPHGRTAQRQAGSPLHDRVHRQLLAGVHR